MIIKRSICIAAIAGLCAAGMMSCGDGDDIQSDSVLEPNLDDPNQDDPNPDDPNQDDPNPDDPNQEEKPKWPDADGDTISDYYEFFDTFYMGELGPSDIPIDTDGDTVPDYLDTDSDGDTIPDSIEAQNGGDTRQKPVSGVDNYAFRSLDTDGNGIPDSRECRYGVDLAADPDSLVDSCDDTDGDTVPDFIERDNDKDGVLDIYEITGLSYGDTFFIDCDGDGESEPMGTPDRPFDCDGDGIPDYLDVDSDGDTILDVHEQLLDSDGDGMLNRYSKDSDGDTIPDSVEKGDGDRPVDTDGDTIPDYADPDSDNDGLADGLEVVCDNLGRKDGRLFWDNDLDGTSDLAEYLLAQQNNIDPKELICNPDRTAKEFVQFYFELPLDAEEALSDQLFFRPLITKADVLLNIDHTGSMETMINQLKAYFVPVAVPAVRSRVPDTAFGVSKFGDSDAKPLWELMQDLTTDITAFSAQLNKLNSKEDKTDIPEAGFESLYQIANGGAHFRAASLPIVIHVTNAESHATQQEQALKKLGETGIRVIPLYNVWYDAQANHNLQATQSKLMAQRSNARVPVCAFQKDDGSWYCGKQGCCTSVDGSGSITTEQPDSDGYCNLAFKTLDVDRNVDNTNILAWQTMIGVEALVKYSTYTVSTRVIGQPIPAEDAETAEADTSCFIQKIVADSYAPPESGAAKECTASTQTAAFDFNNRGYNDSFKNFAVGAASPDSPTSTLTFDVVAKNNKCVRPSEKPRRYSATIEVFDPVTGLVFDSQTVMIIVPGQFEDRQVVY